MRWNEQQFADIAKRDVAVINDDLADFSESRFFLEETRDNSDDDMHNLTGRLLGLYAAFGAKPDDWQWAYIGRNSDESYQTIYSCDSFREESTKTTIGKLILEDTFHSLDFEDEEDGSRLINWYFWLGSAYILEIAIEATHWTDIHYRHPATNEMMPMTDEERITLEDEYDTEIDDYSKEVGFSIKVDAVVSKFDPNNS